MRRVILAALGALATLAATPAWACMGPMAHHLLADIPDHTPSGTAVMRVELTNRGDAFRRWQARMPELDGWRAFVGVARRIDGHGDDVFPVYALISSCTPDFFFDSPGQMELQTWLVGRFVELNGQRALVALSRSADGRWERF